MVWFSHHVLFTGPTTVTTTDKIRFMSSGRPFQGAEIRIDNPEGEMVRLLEQLCNVPIREVSSFQSVMYRLEWSWDLKMCPY